MITLKSTEGLHASIASKVVQLAGKYDANVQIKYDNITIDAKSILGLLSLAIPKGENLEIVAEGTDALQAIQELQKLLG